MYYNTQVMLTSRGHVITPLFGSPCLYITYFEIVNVKIRYGFGFMIFDTLTKLHNKAYKAGFIANSSSCTTTEFL